MNNEPDYADGVKNERERCVAICEAWQRPSYINTNYGPIDAYGMSVLLKAIKDIEDQIRSGAQL
jgi:hypothetical protein